ncbi:MAG: P1 family peptidase [Hyphomicrobiaceae bacterium]|nr:P1 family peptidase [Hyphomicrobiaceae bacterium]
MLQRSNLVTDVTGISVGNADDAHLASGVTVVRVEGPNVAAVTVRGGAPGGRDVGLLEPEMTVEGVNAVVLSGGSAFGLDAAGGVMSVLHEQGVGLRVGGAVVPIVSQAIVFDLLNGGDKAWAHRPPYWDLGRMAALAARASAFSLGTVGGGYGATTANLKGGLGSASALAPDGTTVGAIVVVNAVGTATIGDTAQFWAAPVEQSGEFGGLGSPTRLPPEALALRIKGGAPPSTTIGLVATDATLTKAEAKRLALMADDGLGRSLRPSHAPMDGDTVFAVATQRRSLGIGARASALTMLGTLAADCLARAVARAVFSATALPIPGALPAWRDRFGRQQGGSP